ncbi:hypothetical protein LINPERHAP1_LOCUS16134, partial [Linum perenne]
AFTSDVSFVFSDNVADKVVLITGASSGSDIGEMQHQLPNYNGNNKITSSHLRETAGKIIHSIMASRTNDQHLQWPTKFLLLC